MSDIELIERFNDAWLRGDLEAVLACVADDIVYSTSGRGGQAVTYRSRDEVAKVFAENVGDDSGLKLGPIAAGGGRAVCDWSYPPAPDGTTLRGVDVYAVAGGLIHAKDVFAKVSGGLRPGVA